MPREAFFETCKALRDTPELNFSFLAEMTAVDWWPKEPRFEVVYHFANIGIPDFPVRRRVRRRASACASRSACTATTRESRRWCPLWPNANWYEREVYDLFGIVFERHPDLAPRSHAGRVGRPPGPQGLSGPGERPGQQQLPLQVTEQEFVANIEAQRVKTRLR